MPLFSSFFHFFPFHIEIFKFSHDIFAQSHVYIYIYIEGDLAIFMTKIIAWIIIGFII
jgi:hypothetical protein